jgi:hypothetical protein
MEIRPFTARRNCIVCIAALGHVLIPPIKYGGRKDYYQESWQSSCIALVENFQNIYTMM